MSEEITQEEMEKAFFDEYGLTIAQVTEITTPICMAFMDACKAAGLPPALCAGAAINLADGMVRSQERPDLAASFGLRFIHTHLALGGTGFAVNEVEVPPREEMN